MSLENFVNEDKIINRLQQQHNNNLTKQKVNKKRFSNLDELRFKQFIRENSKPMKF